MSRSEIVEENLICSDDTSEEGGRVSMIVEIEPVHLQCVATEGPANDGSPKEVMGSDPQCPTCRAGKMGGDV